MFVLVMSLSFSSEHSYCKLHFYDFMKLFIVLLHIDSYIYKTRGDRSKKKKERGNKSKKAKVKFYFFYFCDFTKRKIN